MIPPDVRARIADAVHRAVCEVTGSGGFGHCALYATAGALAACHAAGRGDAYVVNAGRMTVYTGVRGAGGEELRLAMDPALTGTPGAVWLPGPGDAPEYHAWFVRRPVGARPGTLQRMAADAEIADLSVRHYREWADLAGLPWRRPPLPDWYWGTASGLLSLQVTLSADAGMTARLLQEQARGPVAEVVKRAIASLDAAGIV